MGGTIVLTLIEVLLILLALLISKAIRFISPSLYGDQLVVDHSTKDDLILTQMPSPSSSHIVVSSPTTKYDVFLSFRGEDTRQTFASYLYEGLCRAGIHTFMDNELRKGEHISQVLLRTIEEAEISMIIFSKNYASSTWCLDELVHILECKEKFGRIVIPIFYNIDPSDIRKQKKSFGKAFDELRRRFEDSPEKSQKWINALSKAANLSGWDSKNTRPESKFVEDIVKDALSKLKYESSCHLEGLVGIARHIRNIENLLTEARIMGIWGMGGAGKTTLAKAIFQELRAQFDAFSFIESVNRQLESISLDKLRQNCLKGVLRDEDVSIYDIGSPSVKKRLGRKKILIILDDVDNESIGEDLTKVLYWCGEGSRLIITSRDKQVLKNASASITYHLPQLEPHQAFHLFSLKAFKQNEPPKRYLELSKWVVDYCKGNPLALKVVGCFLHGRGKEEWESAMKKLNQTLHMDIFNVLKLSFDGLDDTQKNIFLDLAFFLNEAWMISLEDCTRPLYDSFSLIELSVLKERSLISVNRHGYIEMHALLMEMGLEISAPLSISNPEKPIRLWKHHDIYQVLHNGKGIEAIRCMSMDASKMKKTTLRASDFRKMHELIFFKVYKSDRKEPSKLNICEDLDYISEALRFFDWEEYPLSYVPLHFCAENLTILKMRNSNIRRLWKGNQHFPNLDSIHLEDSKHITALPDLSQIPKIRLLFLTGCETLAQIHSSSFKRNVLGLFTDGCGPVQIKIGGSIKRRRSRLVIESCYLDLCNWSFNKRTLKVFVCGNVICGVRFKHEVMPLEEIEELRMRTQSLGPLLPFVRQVEWCERSIEFGDDFNQHRYCYGEFRVRYVDKEESSDEEERGDRGKMMNGHQVVTMSLMKDDEWDDVLMEHCCNESVTFTKILNSITRWSLLKKMTLKSLPLSNEHFRRLKPCLDVTLSFPDIIPPSSRPWIFIRYSPFCYFRCGLAGGYPDGLLKVDVGPDGGPTHFLRVWDKGEVKKFTCEILVSKDGCRTYRY